MTGSATEARAYALKLLQYRNRSEQELRNRLRKKGFRTEDIEETLRSLGASGFVDDRVVAENLKRQAVTDKHMGFQGARRFMQQRGIPRDLIDGMLIYDEKTELRHARILIDKKQKSSEKYPEPKRTRRLIGFLMRKGYSPQVIRKALKDRSVDEELEP